IFGARPPPLEAHRTFFFLRRGSNAFHHLGGFQRQPGRHALDLFLCECAKNLILFVARLQASQQQIILLIVQARKPILRMLQKYRFAGLYDKKNNLLLTRLQPGHEQAEVFCALTQEEIKGVASWLPLEASKMVEGVRTAAEKEERPVGFEGWWTGAENQQTYWNF